MSFKLIVTLGPSILDKDKLQKIDECGECLYRINGAHVDGEKTKKVVAHVRTILPEAKIMVDLPGNKVRTANLSEPIRLMKGEVLFLYDYQINYSDFYTHLKKGDIVRANDSIFTLEVVEIDGSIIKLLSHSDGLLLTNKGLHVRGIHANIPFVFKKDRKLIKAACDCNIDYLALSFVRTAEDIKEVKNLLRRDDLHLIAKVETKAAVKNVEHILKEVDSILVDRGDLSTEIDILKLAAVQDKIVKTAFKGKKNVYLATQFLKNMEKNPIPLIPEVIDLCKTLKAGISGIQLSEETAVGKYPVDCVRLVFDVLRNICD